MMFGLQLRASSVAAESDRQMAMFDQLGPLARDAFNYWPREPDVRTFMRQFKLQWSRERAGVCGENIVADVAFDDPAFDAEFASYIWRKYRELTGTLPPCLVPKKLQRPYRFPLRLKRWSGASSRS